MLKGCLGKVILWSLVAFLGLGVLFSFHFLVCCRPSLTQADWRATSPDPRYILVQLDVGTCEKAATSSLWGLVRRLAPGFAWRWEGRFIQRRRESWEAELKDISRWNVKGHEIANVGFWKSPIGQSRIGKGPCAVPIKGVDVIYQLFLRLRDTLADGDEFEVLGPEGTVLKGRRDPDMPTPFIRVNQVGYASAAERRYAYLGGWLGTSGAWTPPADALTFELVAEKSGRIVRRGELSPRPTPGTAQGGILWTGELTQEIDLSGSLDPGRYFLRIPGVGRSYSFLVSDEGPRTALSVHLHGMLVQRCGYEGKVEPRTHWGDAACHLEVWRGCFPPEQKDYGGGSGRVGGFYKDNGDKVEVSHFDIIERSTDWASSPMALPGGWHDAADYDRRPGDLSLIADLTTLARMKGPARFARLLEEADWGLNHLLLAQEENGGVGGWIETVRHPREGEGMPSQDRLRYALSRSTRDSSLAYAAAASALACCTPELSRKYLASAQKALAYAYATAAATNVAFQALVGGKVETVFWREEPELSALNELRAALNLAEATGDESALADLASPRFCERFASEFRAGGWKWSPLEILSIAMAREPALASCATLARSWILGQAERRLKAQESQPYRLPRANGTDLAWGTSHPLVSARYLVAAHLLTGESRFLTGAYLAYDYHCGCNPDGMTLTSGLGICYPVQFLSLQSVADEVDEYVAGITPYHWTYGVGGADYELVHTAAEVDSWPIWRRRVFAGSLNVAGCEYAVLETIGPAAVVTAYLCGDDAPGVERAPRAPRLQKELPGYWALP